jgi:Asp-tRNA(Asn)/Glu-tRNA(Gln) amidotransferase A subunit family amidase
VVEETLRSKTLCLRSMTEKDREPRSCASSDDDTQLGCLADENRTPSGGGIVLRVESGPVANIFNGDLDLLVMPTWKQLPIGIDARRERFRSSEDAAPQLFNTVPFNVLGLPAISIPCGFTNAGLPVGLQIVGRPFSEAKVLALAHAFVSLIDLSDGKVRVSGHVF